MFSNFFLFGLIEERSRSLGSLGPAVQIAREKFKNEITGCSAESLGQRNHVVLLILSCSILGDPGPTSRDDAVFSDEGYFWRESNFRAKSVARPKISHRPDGRPD